MAVTPSTMLELGTKAPDFTLPDYTGKSYSLEDFRGKKALVVMFICNHCPFVKHLADDMAAFGKEFQDKGVGVVAISSNNVNTHPEDSPEKMAEEANARGYTFPYLYDETQEVAKAYRAACTPDYYVFDGNLKLVYRGQYDDSRPEGEKPVTGKDLRDAVNAVLSGQKPSSDQKPSVGCNIKWIEGNEPDYFKKPS